MYFKILCIFSQKILQKNTPYTLISNTCKNIKVIYVPYLFFARLKNFYKQNAPDENEIDRITNWFESSNLWNDFQAMYLKFPNKKCRTI